MKKKKTYRAPHLAELLMKWFYPDRGNYTTVGDLAESYNFIAVEEGLFKARIWYYGQLLKSIVPLIINSFYWGIEMFLNYIKIALRNFLKHKVYSAINLSGLVLGFSVFLIFAVYVYDELSYDRFHDNSDKTYRVYLERVYPNSVVNFAGIGSGVGPAIKSDIPGVEKMTRVHSFSNSPRQIIEYDGKRFVETNNLYFTDNNFFEVFNAEFIKGNKATALKNPNSVVISDEAARKYFGNNNPIGKTLVYRDTLNYTVTGVVEKFPQNSHFRFDFLVSGFSSLYTEEEMLRWGNELLFRTYIVLGENADPQNVESMLPDLTRKYMPAIGGYSVEVFDNWVASGNAYNFRLEKLTDIHLYSTDKRFEFQANGNITYVYLFSIVGFFVLFISCFNFINLITAKSSTRAKEIGVRKVMGSNKKQIIYQFMSESIIVVFIAMLLSLPIVEFSLTFLTGVINKKLSLINIASLYSIAAMLLFTLFIGVLSGAYPSFILSKFQPVKIIKGTLAFGSKRIGFRNLLMSIQFGLSIAMVIATLAIYKQMEYLSNQKLGFSKDQVMIVNNANLMGEQVQPFIAELVKRETIQSASHAFSIPGTTTNLTTLEPVNSQADDISASSLWADENILSALEIELIAGRNFRADDAIPDTARTIIVNETFANILGGKLQAVSKEMRDLNGRTRTIVGVANDFNFESLHSSVKPLVCFPTRNVTQSFSSNVIVKIKTSDIKETIQFVENKWKAFIPSVDFDYSFLDEEFNKQYDAEQRTLSLFYVFAAIAIFVACLGLLGLSAFASQQRSKEIGVRKVLGANVTSIILTLSSQFFVPIFFANLLGWLTAYIIVQNWLEDFAYRIDLGVGLFAAASVLILIISFGTIWLQSYKAAVVNPIDSIRSE